MDYTDTLTMNQRINDIVGGKYRDYVGDMNAAIQLLLLMPMGAVGILEDEKTWFSNSYLDGAGVLADEEADTPAMAICKAFMVFKGELQATPHDTEGDTDGH